MARRFLAVMHSARRSQDGSVFWSSSQDAPPSARYKCIEKCRGQSKSCPETARLVCTRDCSDTRGQPPQPKICRDAIVQAAHPRGTSEQMLVQARGGWRCSKDMSLSHWDLPAVSLVLSWSSCQQPGALRGGILEASSAPCCLYQDAPPAGGRELVSSRSTPLLLAPGPQHPASSISSPKQMPGTQK